MKGLLMFFDPDSGGYLVFLVALLQTICLGFYLCFLEGGQAAAAPGDYTSPLAQAEEMGGIVSSLEEDTTASADGNGEEVNSSPNPGAGKKEDCLPVSSGPVGGNLIALTFDDGPSPKWTPKYLEILEKHGAQATFFVVGEKAMSYPEQLRAVVSAGHELGAHSLFHQRLAGFSSLEMLRDLRATQAIIAAVAGVEASLFRPPYGEYNEDLLAAALSLGQRTILWNMDPKDWTSPSPDYLVKQVVSKAKDGAIILLHEGKKNTWQALPKIIEGLQDRGFSLVTVSELLAAHSE
ncbi:MAG: polysaccharide deacetylase family protein [Bacillota bacterium]